MVNKNLIERWFYMKKYLLFLLLATLVLFAGCQSTSIDKPNTEGSNITDSKEITDQSSATQTVEVIEIIDMTKTEDITCADALQKFYADAEYNYFYSCIKSEYVIVEYSDGSQKTVEEALKIGDITIEDLDKFEIKYYKKTLDGKETQVENQGEPFQKTTLNVDEISSVTIKIFTSLNGGPKQKIITDRVLISEMVEYWNSVVLKNKVESVDPGTTLSVVFNGDVAFSINNGYLGYDGNYYEQPGRLEEQFKKFYSLAKEKETTIEY